MKSIKKRISLLLVLVLVAFGACVLFMNGNEAQAADVDNGILEVKMQISNSSITDGTVTAHRAIRFISSVDSLDYSEVGFIVNGKSHAIHTVYEKIDSTLYEGGEKLEYTFSPKIVDVKSEYFFTAKMAITEAKMNDDITVQAYLKTFAGQVVVGEERVVSAGKDTSDTSINLTVTGELDENATYTAAFESKVNSEVTSVKETAAAVEVLSVGEGYSNVRITLTGTNKVSDMASVTAIAINGTEATGVYRNYHTSYLSGTNAGKPDTSWYDVYANEKEFVIATNADLYGFATVNENFAGDSVYLISDIKANDGTAKADGFTGTTNYDWTPIGQNYTSEALNFAGTFDGQGHTISGVYLSRTGTANGFWGLFGATGNCTIENFTLANSYLKLDITNSANMGSVVGCSTGVLDTIQVAEDVFVLHTNSSKEDYTGGIVGKMSGTKENGAKISNCQFAGQITASDYVGCIVAIVSDAADATTASSAHKKAVEIEHCLNNGKIVLNGTGNCIGGICGTALYAQVEVKDTLNTSAIDLNTSYAVNTLTTGSLFGWIRNNYLNAATTTDGTENTYTVIVNNSYGTSDGNWKSMGYRNSKGHTKYDGTVYAGSGALRVSFLSASNLTGEKGYLNMNLDFTIGDDYAGYWTATTGTPVLSSFATDLQTENKLAVEEMSTPRTVWYANTTYADTKEYTLYSMADMFGFASLTDVDFAGKTVKLGADITMNKGTASATGFTPATSGAALVEWTPRNMAGTFDGDNHTIQGVYLDTTTGNAGLFASVTGTVKNLRLQNSYFNCTDATAANYSDADYLYGTGSIAGSLSGTLDTVYSDAIVNHTYAYAGGLVGTVYGTGESRITNSCFAGQISAKHAVGGIVGLVINTDIAMEHCLNAGTVTVTELLGGGLCGYARSNDGTNHKFTLNDCLNVGKITTNQTWCGAGFGRIVGAAASGTVGESRVTVTATSTYWHYEASNALQSWTTFSNLNAYGTFTMTDAGSTENSNTYHLRSEKELIAKTNVNLTFLPEGQESSSTDAYYWVARDGKIPMLESFEDLLTDITY